MRGVDDVRSGSTMVASLEHVVSTACSRRLTEAFAREAFVYRLGWTKRGYVEQSSAEQANSDVITPKPLRTKANTDTNLRRERRESAQNNRCKKPAATHPADPARPCSATPAGAGVQVMRTPMSQYGYLSHNTGVVKVEISELQILVPEPVKTER